MSSSASGTDTIPTCRLLVLFTDLTFPQVTGLVGELASKVSLCAGMELADEGLLRRHGQALTDLLSICPRRKGTGPLLFIGKLTRRS